MVLVQMVLSGILRETGPLFLGFLIAFIPIRSRLWGRVSAACAAGLLWTVFAGESAAGAPVDTVISYLLDTALSAAGLCLGGVVRSGMLHSESQQQ